jgi:small GTP-binding protein
MMDSNPADFVVKIVMAGDKQVGKTSLILRWLDDTFKDDYLSTVGVGFHVKTVIVDGKVVKLQLWDTCGEERFKSISSAYYRQALGVVVVYDITDAKSFESINEWLPMIHEHSSPDVIVLLVGNKRDLSGERCVDPEIATNYAQTQGLSFIETSAKTSFQVDRAFKDIATAVVEKLSRDLEAEDHPKRSVQPGVPIGLTIDSQPPQSGCRC